MTRAASLMSRRRAARRAADAPIPFKLAEPLRPAHGLTKGQHVQALRDLPLRFPLASGQITVPAGSIGIVAQVGETTVLVRWAGEPLSKFHRASDLECVNCAACGADADGTLGIHRDGFGKGPEVPLCDACGGSEEPPCEYLWARIKARRVAAGEAVGS